MTDCNDCPYFDNDLCKGFDCWLPENCLQCRHACDAWLAWKEEDLIWCMKHNKQVTSGGNCGDFESLVLREITDK